LLDEAAVLLGPRRKRKGDDDEARTYGHIVVDEAQDLTPMQLRMVARRSLSGSLTIVGDIAQATGHAPPSDWDDVLAHLPHRKKRHTVELSVNYRTPAQVMDLAAKVLAVAAPHLKPPRSVRRGEPPEFRAASLARLVDEAADAAHELSGALGGTVALVCPPSLAPSLAATLGIDEQVSLDLPISVVPIASAKGLEFDGVVVVEPSLLVDESPQGLRSLYVALTRTTKRLTIVHSQPLPPNLRQ
jgi:DNA helicase IV